MPEVDPEQAPAILSQEELAEMLRDWERRDPLWGGFTAERTKLLLNTAAWAYQNVIDAERYRKLRHQNTAAQKRWRQKAKA